MNHGSWLNRLAVMTTAATVALVALGAVVTSTDSGDAIPDWPLSYGSLLPPLVGGVLYEHTHRMVAGLTAILILLLALGIQMNEARRWVRQLAWGAFCLVVLQALLGGLRVLVVSNDALQAAVLSLGGALSIAPVHIAFAITHALLAQLLLCLIFALAALTSIRWTDDSTHHLSFGRHRDSSVVSWLSSLRALRLFLFVFILLLFLQLMLGALMRHLGAGLAIPDFPLSFGQLVPPFGRLPYDPTVPFPESYQLFHTKVLIHYLHRVGAILIVCWLIWLIAYTIRHHRMNRLLVHSIWALALLVGLEVTLGASAIWTRLAHFFTVSHVTVGAVLLGGSVALWVRTCQPMPKFESVHGRRNREIGTSPLPAVEGSQSLHI